MDFSLFEQVFDPLVSQDSIYKRGEIEHDSEVSMSRVSECGQQFQVSVLL
jgi:hypothetical protein